MTILKKAACAASIAAALAGTAYAMEGEPVGASYVDFFSGAALSEAWEQGYEPVQFAVENGHLVGRQVNPKHGATIRVFVDKTTDVVFAFEAKFSGKSNFNAVMGDPDSKDYTWAGHLARFSVRANTINLSDDVEGFMKLEHRALPKDQRDAASAAHRTDFKPSAPLNDGAWHSYRMETHGETAKLYVDGELLGELTSPGFKHPGKTRFGFTVNGEEVRFDNVVVAPL